MGEARVHLARCALTFPNTRRPEAARSGYRPSRRRICAPSGQFALSAIATQQKPESAELSSFAQMTSDRTLAFLLGPARHPSPQLNAQSVGELCQRDQPSRLRTASVMSGAVLTVPA